MEFQYYGANCIRISTKKSTIVIDDNLEKLGLKSITKPSDISLITHSGVPKQNARFVATMPGEYEIADVVIQAIAARSHMEEEGSTSAVIYKIEADDLKVVVLGHIYPDLSEDQLESIGMIDILFVPVGNSGYTLDGIGALKIIKKIEPKVVVPTHYADKALHYEVPQRELSEAIKDLGMEPPETVSKYKPKLSEFNDTTKLVIIEW